MAGQERFIPTAADRIVAGTSRRLIGRATCDCAGMRPGNRRKQGHANLLVVQAGAMIEDPALSN
jgi:hypothetical protein